MSKEDDFCERMTEMVQEARSGNLPRREFTRRAGLLGLSTAATATLINSVFGRDAIAGEPGDVPSPSPVPPSAPPVVSASESMNYYTWGTRLPARPGNRTTIKVWFTLRSPHQDSPRILTRGWKMVAELHVEGASASGSVGNIRWSGSGSFSPSTGPQSTPNFFLPGRNTVKLSVKIGKTEFTSTFQFDAKDANKYARLGSKARCDADAHGCPACPHPTVGPVIMGSPDYLLDGKPIARVGDRGIHAACCGPNMYEIMKGDHEIIINGKPAARVGDATKHCGGNGKLISTS